MTEAIDPDDWIAVRDAAFMLSRDPHEVHDLCRNGQINYTVRSSDNAWLIHIPSLVEYLTRTIRIVHKGSGDSLPVYAWLAASIEGLEKKVDTIIEGITRMTQADSNIEKDVSELRAIFTAVQALITTLNDTVTALKDQVSQGGAPSAQTLTDLDNVTAQFQGLVGQPPTDTPPSDTPVDTTPPTDTAPPEQVSPPVDSGVDQSGTLPPDAVVPTDNVVDVSNPISDTDAPGVDPVSGGALATDVPADTSTDTAATHTSP